MGTPVPPDIPDLEDAKWYCVTADIFFDLDFWKKCDCIYQGQNKGCRTGAQIKAYYDAGGDCEWLTGFLNPYPAYTRVLCIIGPYDTEGECLAAC